jgi:hypothetical protein
MYDSSIPQQYIVTMSGAYWQDMPAGKRRVWFYAPKKNDDQISWADTVEVECSDEPIELFLDSITDHVLFINAADSHMNYQMELYELIHAVNDAVGMPVAKHGPGQAMGQTGVVFEIGGFRFDVMEDMGDGNSTWLTCYNPADVNKLDPGTPIEMVDQYPGAFDGTVWRTADFRRWIKEAVFRVLTTQDFMYVQPDEAKRAEFSGIVGTA